MRENNFKQSDKSPPSSKINFNQLSQGSKLSPKIIFSTSDKLPLNNKSLSLKINFSQSNKLLFEINFNQSLKINFKQSSKSPSSLKISSSQQSLKSNFNSVFEINNKSVFEINNKPTSEIKPKKVYINIAFELNDEFIYYFNERR